MKDVILSFLQFLKHPKDERLDEQSTLSKLKVFAILFGFEVFIMILLMGIISLLSDYVLDLSDHGSQFYLENLPVWLILLGGTIIMPFIEELIFRFPLKYQRNIPFLILEGLSSPSKSQSIWHNNFRFLFYLSTALFAYIHLFNFGTISNKILLFSPLLIAPQFIMGSVAGYLRVKLGFMWSFALHFCHNLLFIGGTMLAMNATMEKANITQEDYSIKIEEIALSNDPNRILEQNEEGIDTIYNLLNYKPIDLYNHLTGFTVDKIDIQHKEINSLKFNIYLKGKKDSLSYAKQIILKEFNETYQVDLNREMRPSPNWNLVVVDSSLLLKHQLEEKGFPNTTGKSLQLKTSFEYYKVNQLAIYLNSSFADYINTSVDLQYQFHFEDVPIDQLKKTDDYLREQYGLGFEQDGSMIEYLVIKEKE